MAARRRRGVVEVTADVRDLRDRLGRGAARPRAAAQDDEPARAPGAKQLRVLPDRNVALGHTFRTASDTEVIVHAWEQWGDCFRRFNGQRDLALWVGGARRLVLSSNRLNVDRDLTTDERGFS